MELFVGRQSVFGFIDELESASRRANHDSLGALLTGGQFSDVHLLVGDHHRLACHKNILAAQSPVFAAMFQSDMREARDGEVRIPDLSAETCQSMLRFIYTGEVRSNECYTLELLEAADKV